MAKKVTVYRFRKVDVGHVLSPRYMAGTLQAIAELGAEPIEQTARLVEAKLLEGGFFYEHTPTNAMPGVEPLADEL